MSWPRVRISEVTEIVSGATPKTGVSNYWSGEIAWATPADLSGLIGTYIDDTPRKITEAGLRSCAASVLPANSVLFSSRAPIGHVAINTVPMATNQGFKSFVPDEKVLDTKFLFWWLKAHRVQLEAMGSGATFKEVSKATVSRVEIPLPPLDEQKRIAAILDKADQLRQKRRQAIALLDSLTQSIFIEMFGDSVSNPKGWPTQSVGEFCELIVDCVNRTAPLAERITDFKMIRTTNVKNGRLLLSEVRYVEEEIFNRWNRRATPKIGDVILTREAPVGEVGMLDVPGNFFLGQRLMLYRPDRDKMIPEYMLRSFQSEFLTEQFRQGASGSTVKHLPLPTCRSFEFRIPPIEIQRQFSRRVASIKSNLTAIEAMTFRMDEVFSSLQHRAFSGEL